MIQSTNLPLKDVHFEHGIIAFLDMLGFTEKFKASINRLSLLSLQIELSNLLDGKFNKNQNLNGSISYRPEVTCVSDSIIVSVPFNQTDEPQEILMRLKTFFLAIKTIIFFCLARGILIRGGISVGELLHKSTIISGIAYIDAVELEKTENHPKVRISEQSIKILGNLSAEGEWNVKKDFSLKRDNDSSRYWFDILSYYPTGYHFFYNLTIKDPNLNIDEGHCNVEEFVDILIKVKAYLNNEIIQMQDKPKSDDKKTTPKEKILWAIDYINQAIEQYMPSVEAHRRLEYADNNNLDNIS